MNNKPFLNTLFSKKNDKSEERYVFVIFSSYVQEITLIRTGFLNSFIAVGYTVILFVPPPLEKRIRDFFADNQKIIIVSLDYDKRLITTIEKVIAACLFRKYEKRFGPYLKERLNKRNGKRTLLSKIKNGMLRIFSHLIPESFVVFILNYFLSDQDVDKLFLKFTPRLVIMSWGGVYGICPVVNRSARKFNCRTISVDCTWDNMDEVPVISKVDRLLVWGQEMKSEAIARHNYKEENVVVVGPMRCCFYRDTSYFLDKKEFFAKSDLDIRRKIITFVSKPGSAKELRSAVNTLLSAQAGNLLWSPIQIFIRVSPFDAENNYREYLDNPLVKIKKIYKHDTDQIISESDIIESVNLLRYTDVQISFLSTLIIESLYYDIPNISLRSDSVRYLYERDFMTSFCSGKGVRSVDSPSELVESVNQYLADPTRGSDSRRSLLRVICDDGQAGVKSKIVAEVNKMLADENARIIL